MRPTAKRRDWNSANDLARSDHLTVFKYRESETFLRLSERLRAAGNEAIGATIVNVEEQMRGWLAAIAKERAILRQIPAYRELTALFSLFSMLDVITVSVEAAERFEEMRSAGVKIGTMDLKIGCIAIVNDALLLTRNRRDFEKIPGLRFENWLD